MADSRLHVGTSGWSYRDRVGFFDPTAILPRDFLACYSTHFGAVEIDSTFYHTPTATTVDTWKTGTPETFRFAPKVLQAIIHETRLRDCTAGLVTFLEVMHRLGLKLRSLVFQFDASSRVDSLPLLAGFLAGLAPDLRYAVENRHRGWLSDAFYRLLENRHPALVLADPYYMPRLNRVATDLAYIRLLGKRSANRDDFSRVRPDREPKRTLWAGRIREYLGRGIAAFAVANNCLQGHGPPTARALPAKVAEVASEP